MKMLEARIIIKLAENGLRITPVAKQLFMSRSSVTYHIKKIHATTGRNPLDFYGMCKLLPVATAIVSKEAVYRD